MKKIITRVKNWFTHKIKAITPGKDAVKGATIALGVIPAILYLLFAILTANDMNDPWILVLFLALAIIISLIAFLVSWILKKIISIPKWYRIIISISLPLLFIVTAFEGLYVIALFCILSCLGASLYIFYRKGFKELTLPKKIITILGLLIGITGFVTAIILYSPKGFDVAPIANAAQFSKDYDIASINAMSPAIPGSYEVETITYGSGKDKHRLAFGSDVGIITESVNGVPFIDNWSGLSGWWREQYWGFDSKALPLNAKVWYPKGEGPFPLALIVHGNHSMQDYSDTGYEYLGELLASRGIILASVDQNFINSSWSDIVNDGLDEENDARGWLLLEHLRLWHEWNKNDAHQFYNKIDTSKLSLIGHSRGGEAVAHAAMLNTLPYYPDDASIILDYQFDITSIIAIAPVDGQYQPGNTRTKVKNVDYFVLHGAQDADVQSYSGSKQYERIHFSDSLYHLKAGLYIYGANHGQFNTSWGDNDVGIPFKRLLNLKQLLSGDDQRTIAKVYISAFLEATLKNNTTYLPLFTDARTGKDWLPETIYLNQFEDTNMFKVCDYDEDFNVVTTSIPTAQIQSENLTVWREEEIPLKWGKKGSRAVVLGWNYEKDHLEKKIIDTTKNSKKVIIPDTVMARYTIKIDSLPSTIDSTSVFIFSMAEASENSDPKSEGKWVNDITNKENTKGSNNNSSLSDEEGKEESTDDDDEAEDPIDFSIQLKDHMGEILHFPLSDFSYLQREIEPTIWKSNFVVGGNESENVFQLFSYPITQMRAYNTAFDFNNIKEIHFVFDITEKGVVRIDNIGFMKSLLLL